MSTFTIIQNTLTSDLGEAGRFGAESENNIMGQQTFNHLLIHTADNGEYSTFLAVMRSVLTHNSGYYGGIRDSCRWIGCRINMNGTIAFISAASNWLRSDAPAGVGPFPSVALIKTFSAPPNVDIDFIFDHYIAYPADGEAIEFVHLEVTFSGGPSGGIILPSVYANIPQMIIENN